ncbi:MAG: hypothetical protein KC503_11995, partial [Myxococcales bacterium]|nr:hypothetical protein [Myxococcales bacterium]
MQARIRTSSVLLLCSDRNACAALIHRLQDDGHVVAVAESIEEAEEALEQSVDLLIVDGLDHPEGDGPTLLDRLPSRLDAPAILLTPDHQGTEVARALRHGAACALDSPVDVDALALTVLRTLETDRQRRVARAYQQQLATNLAELVGSSPAMQQVRALVDRVAASPTRAVLLC